LGNGAGNGSQNLNLSSYSLNENGQTVMHSEKVILLTSDDICQNFFLQDWFRNKLGVRLG
jgi:hypothetical protein